jgi:hypothetical protein
VSTLLVGGVLPLLAPGWALLLQAVRAAAASPAITQEAMVRRRAVGDADTLSSFGSEDKKHEEDAE